MSVCRLILTRNLTPIYEWDADAVLQRYEHDINNSAIGNEYKTIGIKHKGPTGGHSKSGRPEGADKTRGLVAHD